MKVFILFGTLVLVCLKLSTATAGIGSFMLNNAIKITHPIESEKNVSYGSQTWQSLNVYPKQQASPVVIFIYGGGWSKGSKEQYHFVADALVRLGYVVVIPDYIKYPDGKFPSFINDIALATAWVKHNITDYGGNPQQLFMVGHSAGAYNAAMLLADSTYLNIVGLDKQDIKGFVGLAGPYNFTPQEPKYIQTFGRENFKQMKVNHHVDGTEPATLLLHSTGDKTVGLFNFETFRNRLSADGVHVKTKLYDNLSHVDMVLKIHPWFAGEIDLRADINAFFQQLLKQSEHG